MISSPRRSAKRSLCLFLLILAGACSSPTSPEIKPCTYVGRQDASGTYIISYETLPCFDDRQWRVIKKR